MTISAARLAKAQVQFERAKSQFSNAAVSVLQRKPGAATACAEALAEIERARKQLSSIHGSPCATRQKFQTGADLSD